MTAAQKCTHLYLCFMLLFPLAVPMTGYVGFSAFKYTLFLLLSLAYLLTLGVLWLVDKEPKNKEKKAASFWLYAYLLLSCISAFVSPYLPDVLYGSFRCDGLMTTLIYGAVFLAVRRFFCPKRYLIWVLSGSITLYALIAFLQLLGKNPLSLYTDYNFYEATPLHHAVFIGTTGNAGHAASFLCLAAGFLWGYLLFSSEKLRHILWVPLCLCILLLFHIDVDAGIVGFIGGVALVFPFSLSFSFYKTLRLYPISAAILLLCRCFHFYNGGMRFTGSVFTLFVWLIVALWVALTYRLPDTERSSTFWRRTAFGLLGTFLVVGVLYLYFLPISSPLFLWQAHELLHGRFDDSFGSGRLFIWRQVLSIIKNRPLLGYGPDSVGFLPFKPFQTYDASLHKTFTSGISSAHNEYLQILLCQGILALFAYAAFLGTTLWKALRHTRKSVYFAAASAALSYAVAAFFGIAFVSVTPLFWLALAVASASFTETERNLL